MKYYPFINGLRALAVVPIILFHFNVGAFSGGYAGVDVFFVISGFLITGLLMDMLDRGKFSLVEFYERRARRILPALFGMCLLCCAFALLYFMPEDFTQFSHSLLGVALFASNYTFWEDVGYFNEPAQFKPLLHTWSLAVEEQFYLIFPLVLYALYKRLKGEKRKLAAAVGALLAISLLLNLALIESHPDATFYFLHTRAWELLTGSLVYLYLQHVPLGPRAMSLLNVLGLGLLALSYFAYDRSTAFPGSAAIAPCLGTALLIWANVRGETATGKVLGSPVLAGIGLVSYGLYLYHWPVLVFTRYYLSRDLTRPEIAAALVCVCLLAWLSYVCIEKPVRHRGAIASTRHIFAGSLAGLLLVATVGVAGAKTEGLPYRFPKEVLGYVVLEKAPTLNCDIKAPREAKRAQWCAIGEEGDDARPDFILWGDSHADKLSPAVDALAKEHHLHGVLASLHGCTPVLGLEHMDEEEPCPRHNAKVLQYIRDKKIKNIILAARWDIILPYEEHSIEAIRNLHGPRVTLKTPSGATLQDVDAFSAAFHDTIAELLKQDVHVWVFRQVPSHLAYISSALGKAALAGRNVSALDRPLEQILRRRAPVKQVFSTVTDPRVSFIDPVGRFCANGRTCIVSAKGRSLYKDDSHLTVFGALWTEPLLAPIFDQLAQQTDPSPG